VINQCFHGAFHFASPWRHDLVILDHDQDWSCTPGSQLPHPLFHNGDGLAHFESG
jgi:hypothetical protein